MSRHARKSSRFNNLEGYVFTLLFALVCPFVIHAQNTAPPAPDLVFPINNARTIDTTPTLAWRIPTDADGDSLHFKVEVATDTNFTTTSQISGSPFESRISTTSFSPTPPLKQGALSFDGVDDYVITPDMLNYFSNETVTIEVWFKANSAGVILSELGQSSINGSWHDSQIEVLNTGEVKVRVWNLTPVSLGTVGFETWHHAALRYNETTQVLDGFLDGVEASSDVSGDRNAPSSALYYAFGTRDDSNLGSGAYFNGTMDEVHIWNVARTQAQIHSDMYTQLTGTETGLVAYWDFNETSGDTAYDKTANNNDGTINGATRVTNEGKGTGSYTVQSALSTGDYYWRVSAHDGSAYGSASSHRKFTIQGDITPYNLTTQNSTTITRAISLTWDIPIGATVSRHIIYRSVTSDFTSSDSIGGTTTETYTDTGLVVGKTYYYRVAAVDDLGNKSGYSSQASGTAGSLVGGQISSDSTWDISGSPYVVSSTISIYNGSNTPDTLTIKPGVTVKFKSGAELQVGRPGYSYYPGVLIAEGTSDSVITFTSVSGATNAWKGIYFAEASDYGGVKSSLKHCIVENAGESNYKTTSSGIYFYHNNGHTLDSVTVRSHTGFGVCMINSSATFTGLVDSANTSDGMYLDDSSPTVTNSRFRNNGGYGINLQDQSRPSLRKNILAGNTNDGILVEGGQIASNWALYQEGSPYTVTSTISIYNGSNTPDTLTIKPGVTVKFKSGAELQVGRPGYSYYPGVLIAEGTSDSVITFTSDSDSTNGWKGIYFANASDYGGVKSSLKHCIVENAGESNYQNTSSGIYFHYSSGHTLDSVTVRSHTGYGVCMINSSATFTGLVDSANTSDGMYLDDSSPTVTNSRFRNNGGYGINLQDQSRPTLRNNILAGNTNDGILVEGGDVTSNWTLNDNGVPYIITSTIEIKSGSTVSIKPDVTMKFQSGTALHVGRAGSSSDVGVLVAEGKSDSVITFTSFSDSTNGWKGIYFASGSDYGGVKSSLKHCIVEKAGESNYRNHNCGTYFYYTSGHTLDSVTVRGNTGYGVSLHNSSPTFTGLLDSTNTSDGIYLYTSSPTITKSRVKNNGGYAIKSNSIGNLSGISNLNFSGNTNTGVYTSGGNTSGNTTLGHYGDPYWTILSDVTVAGSDTLTVEPGVTVRFAPGSRLQIGSGSTPGRLYAVGKLDSMITFTTTKDTMVGGWEGIYFDYASDYGGFTSKMKYCIIEKGGAREWPYVEANIKTYNTTQPGIDSCIVRNSSKYGIWITGSSVPTITNCDIYSHKSWYLYNNTSPQTTVTASSCYWGTQSGIELGNRYQGIVTTTGMKTTSVFSNTNVLTPPYSPTAEAATDSTVKLNWTGSTSKTVAKYYIYRNDGYGNIDYSSVIDSVSHPTVTWTSPALTKGLVYKFGVRAAQSDGTKEENFDITAEGPVGGHMVSGAITDNTTWTAGGRPYRFVEGHVTVSADKVLTIEPGVTVKFRRNYYLQVDGGLRAVGTATDTIRFTSYNQNPEKGNWWALKFTDSAIEDTNKLDYCVVEYGGSNSTENAAIYGKNSKLTVDHSIVRHSNKNGIYMNGGDLTVSNTQVHNNTESGIRNTSGTTVLTGVSSFKNSDHGIYMSSATLTVSKSYVYRNTERGIYHYSSGNLTLSSTTVDTNGQEGIYFSGTQLTIGDSTLIRKNGEHGIEVYSGLTLKNSYIQDNTEGNTYYYGVRFERYNNQVQIDSTEITGNANGLYVRSASAGSIVQRSKLSNNSVYGIRIEDPDVTIDADTITNNGTGIYLTAAAVVNRNLISSNQTGVWTSSTPRINFNNIHGNTGYYLENGGSSDVDAKTNWWGTTEKATIDERIKDKSDGLAVGLVNYTPFLTDTVRLADTTAPVLAGIATGYESTTKTLGLISGEWYDYATPHFEWSPATDTYPVVGYSVLLTDDTAATAIPDDVPDVYDTTYTVSQTLTEGNAYYFKVRAVDNNYNASETVTMFIYKYDVGSPLAFDLASPADGETAGTRPVFRWNAAQDSAYGSGIEKYRVYIDDTKIDSTGGESTVFVVKDALSEGDHTWYIVAVDSGGHSRSSTQTWTVNVSRSTPEAPSLTFPYHSSIATDTLPTLTWLIPTDTDNDSLHFKVEVATDTNFTSQISGSPFESKTSTARFSPTPPLRQGNALEFDGSYDYARISDNPSLDITESITIEAWVNPRSYQDHDRIVSKPWTSNNIPYNIYSLNFTNDYPAKANFAVAVSSEEYGASSISTVPLDRWTHLAGTYDGETVKIYCNGVEQGSNQTPSGPIDTNDMDVYIGYNALYPWGQNFSGVLDEVRIWNVARTKDQIRQDMYTRLTGNEEGLAAYFDFNGTSSSTVYDRTANGNNGEIHDAVRLLNSGADMATYTLQSEPTEGDYYWRVSAWDGRGYGNASEMWMFSVKDVHPTIVLSTDSLNFGLISTNNTRSLPIEIANHSKVRNLVIFSISSSNTAFNISPTTLTVTPGEIDTVSVSFTPTTLGPYVATLTIDCNDPDQPTRTVHLSGKGAPVIVASTPAQNAANVSEITDISATFSADMDISTLVDTNFIVFGDVSGRQSGAISYDDATRTITFSPESSFIFGERVQVVLTEDVVAETETIPLVNGYSWEFTVAPLFGSGEYSLDTTSYTTGASPYAIAVGDFDGSSTQIFSQSPSVPLSQPAVGKHLKGKSRKLKQSKVRSITGNLPVSISSTLAAAGIRYPDFVVANSGANTISVFINEAGLISQTPTNYTVGTTPEGVAVADIDGDGDVDIITANNVSNNISVLLNEGDGTFGTASNYAVGTGPRAIAVGDLDNDGDLDIVSANIADNAISILFNDGTGVFGNLRNIGVGDLPGGIVLEDLDNDGDMDIAVSNKNSDDITVLLKGEGLVQDAGMALKFDGVDDYVDLSPSYSFTKFTLELWRKSVGSGSGGYPRVVTGSSIGDGFTIEHSGNNQDYMSVWMWADGESKQVAGLALNQNEWYHIALTFDGTTARVYLNGGDKGSNTFTSGKTLTINTLQFGGNTGLQRYFNGVVDEIRIWDKARPEAQIQADMNRPLTGNEWGLVGYWPFDEGSGTTTTDASGSGNTGTLINGPEWVTSTAPVWSPTTTVGKFSVAGSYAVGTAPNGLVAGDFDGDGDVDLATANGTSNDMSILFNDGNGVFSGLTNVSAGSEPMALYGNDLDADGDMDLAVANSGDDNVVVFLNDQSGTFTAEDTVSVGSSPRGITGLDISGDLGIIDLAVTNLIDRNVSILKNQIPGGLLANVTPTVPGEQSGDVTLTYNVYEVNRRGVGLLGEYSVDNGTTWITASVTGDTSQLAPEKYRGEIIWNSETDLPFVTKDSIVFKITAYVDTLQQVAVTGTFPLDNDHRQSVVIAIADTLSEYSDSISVKFVLTDSTYDVLDLVGYYKIGVDVWTAATLVGDVADLDSSQYQGVAIWPTRADLAGIDDSVRLKVVPSDGWAEGVGDSTATFHLDNNEISSVQLTDLVGEQTGDVSLQYDLSDAENDPLDITLNYSTDAGASWTKATVTGDTAGITAYSGSLIWNSKQDLPGRDIATAKLKLIPMDNDTGMVDTTAPFRLDNNELPSVSISDLTGEQAEEVSISYVLTDSENDTLSISCEFYDESIEGWDPATVTGETSGVTQSQYSNTVVWHTRTDLLSAEGDVIFRITPRDNDLGAGDTTKILLDNNLLPSLQITGYADTVSVETIIDFTLSDDESDTLSISAFFSTDEGQTWLEPSLSGKTSAFIPPNYSNSVTWLVLQDVGFQRLNNVLFTLTPSDRDPGVADTTGYLTIVNYPADFNGDFVIDTDDLAIFAAAWNAEPQDTLYDIGPATGEIPELTPQPDGVLDFEDLMVFIQMWNWSFGHSGFKAVIATAPVGGSDPASLYLTQRFPENPWRSDGTIVVDVFLEGEDLLMADGVFTFDNTNLEFIDASGGDYFTRSFKSAPFFHQVSPDSDAVLVASVGLGKREKQRRDSEKTPVATIRFKASSGERKNLILDYNLRDLGGEIVESHQITLEVKDLVPDRFALHPNYPNPFNPITKIRFEVPEPTRLRLTIYDILGREVTSLIDKNLEPGYYEVMWDGKNRQGNHVSSGMYLYSITARNFRASRKMVLVR